ncbi:hypothetical protein BDV96DRAFT_607209 [Lophiotrema nucula]|uniref:Uncharacterized protein n=1 Tax=Lophiotrema nucula TaxID=690887 RepID=A0A6A5YID5_9PLEO|nr:hypothetical protein BDV96DRAFT_607209 [Lophiotrema nucula]
MFCLESVDTIPDLGSSESQDEVGAARIQPAANARGAGRDYDLLSARSTIPTCCFSAGCSSGERTRATFLDTVHELLSDSTTSTSSGSVERADSNDSRPGRAGQRKATMRNTRRTKGLGNQSGGRCSKSVDSPGRYKARAAQEDTLSGTVSGTELRAEKKQQAVGTAGVEKVEKVSGSELRAEKKQEKMTHSVAQILYVIT